jgi:hypothetical protein
MTFRALENQRALRTQRGLGLVARPGSQGRGALQDFRPPPF